MHKNFFMVKVTDTETGCQGVVDLFVQQLVVVALFNLSMCLNKAVKVPSLPQLMRFFSSRLKLCGHGLGYKEFFLLWKIWAKVAPTGCYPEQ